jgi:hypothetical protein
MSSQDLGSVIFLLGAVAAAFFALSRARAWHRLSHIPGPFEARWSHLWLVKRLYTGTYADDLPELHLKYGPVVCLAPDLVAVSDPEEIRRIGNVRSPWGRGTPYFGFRTAPGEDSLFSQRNTRAHGVLRKKLIGGYMGKDNTEQTHDMIDNHVLKLAELIETRYVSSPQEYRPLDLSRLVRYMTIDLISCFAFGSCFGCLERDGDFHGYLEATSKIAPLLVSLCMLPLFQAILDTPSMKPWMPKGGFFKPILDVAQGAVAKRFGEQKIEQKDVLGAWVANGLTQKEAEVETVGQLAVRIILTNFSRSNTKSFCLGRWGYHCDCDPSNNIVHYLLPACLP